MTAEQAIRALQESGGWFEQHGENIIARRAPKTLVPVLRELKPEIVSLLTRTFVYMDVPCTCNEKPHPHFRHRDGSGPGSGRTLAPENRRRAHRTAQ